MRLFFLTALCFIFFSADARSQSNLSTYLSGSLIVKFEDQNKVRKRNPELTTKVIKENVISALKKHGLLSEKPLWNSRLNQTLLETFTRKKKLAPNQNFTQNVSRLYEYSYSSGVDPNILAQKISNMPGIEYAEPRYIRTTSLEPNDPLNNTHIDLHNFNEAWDISTGSSDVIIGIIDSGVNYKNIDLKNKAWVNDGEIPNNGIDDDGNGYVDDYLGWDFWESGNTASSVLQDNDPFAEHSDHGTHVAGIATAETNNGVGIAGTGYNSRYMAIKAGGIEDDPGTDLDESRQIGFGYEGILYAVANGADIVNLSWGGPGASNAEREIITFAVQAGVVVVAASGNDNSTGNNSPASYIDVLSVGSINSNSQRSSFSNYGYTTDVFAVGSNVLSAASFDSTTFQTKSGTSMASPVVAGLSGLLKAKFPDWSARRIMHQIRSSANAFENVNNPLLYGNGIVNAQKALSTPMPGISIRSVTITDTDGSSLSVGESGVIELVVANFGKPTSNLTITLEAVQQDLIITNGEAAPAAIATNDSVSINFAFNISQDYDLSDPPTFVVHYNDLDVGYRDFEVFLFDELNFGVLNGNNVTMSFGANGTIGFSDPSSATGGVGFIPAGFSNILFEAGILIMADGNPVEKLAPKLSNNVRNAPGFYDSDFDPDIPFSISDNSEIATAEGSGSFTPNYSAEQDSLLIRLNTFAFDDVDIQNTVFTQYQITNTSNSKIDNFYLGIFTDWDIDNYAENKIAYDSANEFLYIFDPTSENNYPFVAVIPMQTPSANLAINNGFDGTETDHRFNIYDGFDDSEKVNSLTAGLNNTQVESADISSVVASGPYSFNPNVTINIGFMYIYGADYATLKDNVTASRARFVFNVDEPGVYTTTEFESAQPTTTQLFQNYPNPFNPSTNIQFQLSTPGEVSLFVYNALGQKISTLFEGNLSTGMHSLALNMEAFPSGIYFVELNTINAQNIIKLSLIK